MSGGPTARDPRPTGLKTRLGLDDYVEFPGRVPDAELVQRLSSCDVCVNPDPKTPFNDASTMTKILDYMSVAKAIVQFDVLEGRRSAGEASLYARPNDPEDLAAKIVQLLDDPAARERMGRAGRERMETALQWRLQMPNLLAAYDRAMKVRRRRRGRRGRPRRRPGVVASRTRPR